MPSPVEFTRQEVLNRLEDWRDIRAVLEGEKAVKKLGDKLLPRPNPTDTSAENVTRYEAYKTRAVLYNASARTLAGMIGYVFAKPAILQLPEQLKPLEQNADGAGTTLSAQAKIALGLALGFGRGGMLVDFPETSGAVSRADMEKGEIRPTIVLYQPEDVINWDFEQIGSIQKLSLLVLRERKMVRKEDGFALEEQTKYRVYKRVGTNVTVTIHEEVEKEDPTDRTKKIKEFAPKATLGMKGKTGGDLGEIPFVFIGAESNDATVDVPPMLDLVRLNIGHYRNSADYEEASYQLGQPTAYAAGVTESWVKEVWGGKAYFGSRAVLALPVGGTAGIIQAQPNTMPMEAMKAKEAQMISLGARLVEQRTVRRTATETMLDYSSDTSILSSAAEAILLAYRMAFKFAALFVGGEITDKVMVLGEPLARDILDPQAMTAIVAAWQMGALSDNEMRRSFERAGLAFEEDFVPEPRVEEVQEETSGGGEDGKPQTKKVVKSSKVPSKEEKKTEGNPPPTK